MGDFVPMNPQVSELGGLSAPAAGTSGGVDSPFGSGFMPIVLAHRTEAPTKP